MSETEPLLPQNETPSIWKRPNPVILAPALLVFVLSVGLITAPTEQLVMRLVCRELKLGSGNLTMYGEIDGLPKFEECRSNPDVQSETSYWLMTLTLSLTIPALFSVLILGSVSDKIGRLFLLRLCAFGSLITISTHILVGHYPNLTLYTSMVAYIFQGLIGGSSGFLMTSFAYISDTTSKNARTSVFSIFEAFMFVGVMFAPFLGGLLDKMTGNLLVPFYVSAAGLVFVQIYLWNLPESLRQTHSESTTFESAHNLTKSILISTFKRVQIAIETFVAKKHRNIQRLLLIFFLATICFASFQTIYILFTAFKFAWQSYENGNFFLVIAIARTFHMTVVLPLLLKPNDEDEMYGANVAMRKRIKKQIDVITFGFLVYAVGFTAYIFATKEWMFYAVGVIDAFGVVALPTIRGLLSSSTPSNLQGHLFSIMALIEELAGIVSPLIFSNVYSLTVKYFPQATFLVMAGLFFVCMIFARNLNPSSLIVEEEESEIEAMRIDAIEDLYD